MSLKIKENKCLAKLLMISCLGLYANMSMALDNAAAQSAIDDGVSALEAQQDVTEGGWGNAVGIDYVYTAAAIDALHNANQRTGTYYSGVAWLENHHAANNDLAARKIVNLMAHGNNVYYDLLNIHEARTDVAQPGWGLSGGYFQSPLETALVLQALTSASANTDNNTNEASYIALLGQIDGAAAVAYLVGQQQTDGSWDAFENTQGSYWVTAEAIIALAKYPSEPGVSASLNLASTYLEGMSVSSATDVTLARVALALYQLDGLSTLVDSHLTALISNQLTDGSWGDVLATANVISVLSYAMGLNTLSDAPQVVIDQEALRTEINGALGYAGYGQLTSADIASITSLDLRGASISNLAGLEGASNLTQLQVNSSTNLSAIAGLSGVTVFIDSDIDNVADASDNCPWVSNSNQSNIDGDSQGDVCDFDIDGDTMPNDWEGTYAFNAYSASDATGDADNDELINRDEYQEGTNPRDPDSDGDSLEDGVEVVHNLDPLDASDAEADFDSDDLTNAEEIALGTDLNDADTDDDNAEDGYEVLVGRNPLLNEPVLIVIITSLLLN